MVRVPSSRVLLVGAVTAALAVTTVAAVALTGSPQGAVALPRFAPSPPGSSFVMPTVEAAPTLAPLPTLPPLPAAPVDTRPAAPRRTAETTTTAPPTTAQERPERQEPSSAPASSQTRVQPPPASASMDDRVRFACAQGYLTGPMCGQ